MKMKRINIILLACSLLAFLFVSFYGLRYYKEQTETTLLVKICNENIEKARDFFVMAKDAENESDLEYYYYKGSSYFSAFVDTYTSLPKAKDSIIQSQLSVRALLFRTPSIMQEEIKLICDTFVLLAENYENPHAYNLLLMRS